MKGVLKAAVVLAVATVLLLLVGEFVEPQSWPALVLVNYAPFPAYLLPVALAAAASFWLGWAWRVVAVSALLVTLTVVMGFAWGQADAGHGRVRFMTYNIKGYLAVRQQGGVAKLALEVNEHQPDILVMQDAVQLDFEGQGGEASVVKRLVGERHVYHFGQYIVASRWPLSHCRVLGIPAAGQAHGAVACEVEAHGVRLNIVTAHYISPRDGLNAARKEGIDGIGQWQQNMLLRLQQTGMLAEQLRQMSGPIILGGDLNAPETSAVVQTLINTGLRDAFAAAGRGYGYTHGHHLLRGLSFLRIDHILVSQDIGVVDAHVGGTEASQHRPVIADLVVHRD
jgi:endonuclease/exonuclease/phosphatase family metal-dependent hydrolase